MPPFTRRRLPHTCSTGEPVFLTWRLHGSLPPNRHFPANLTSGQAFAAMDHLLDTAITGPLHLSRPEIATTIIKAIQFQQRELDHYQTHAWVIMANHVHLLITPNKPLAAITHTLKRHTAKQANQILHRTGQPFWQDETFDRTIRNPAEFRQITRYIHQNPVKAGLVPAPEHFPYSTAHPNHHL